MDEERIVENDDDDDEWEDDDDDDDDDDEEDKQEMVDDLAMEVDKLKKNAGTMHHGTVIQDNLKIPLSHELRSHRAKQTVWSKQTSERAKRTVRSKQTSERCERRSE